MTIVKNKKGDALLRMLNTGQKYIKEYLPLTHALTAVRKEDQFLLVYNNKKEHWELPGGVIEQGETAVKCALRELFEETSQVVDAILFGGLMVLDLQADSSVPYRRIEHGVLYLAEIDNLAAFEPNEEIGEICLWDGKKDITIDPIDRMLVTIARKNWQILSNRFVGSFTDSLVFDRVHF